MMVTQWDRKDVPFTFYTTLFAGCLRSYMPNVPYLLPASSWSRVKLATPKVPAHCTELAADCGGYVATVKWGGYRYTPEQYVDWLSRWTPKWAATMDFCCEPKIAENHDMVRDRQRKTTEMAYHFWETYRTAPWAWVPTLQGWTVEDYQEHAAEMKPLVREMQRHYGPDSYFRLGIGTLCNRANSAMVERVVAGVRDVLPNVRLHLWGVKLLVLRSATSLLDVVSVDSAAWQGFFGSGRQKWKDTGLSQMQYSYFIALPNYLEKVSGALSGIDRELSIAKEIKSGQESSLSAQWGDGFRHHGGDSKDPWLRDLRAEFSLPAATLCGA